MDDEPADFLGVVLVTDLCRATGLSEAVVLDLVATGRLVGLLDESGAVLGVPEHGLPSAAELRTLGLDVAADYDPAALRSSVDTRPDPDEGDEDDEDPGDSWLMRW